MLISAYFTGSQIQLSFPHDPFFAFPRYKYFQQFFYKRHFIFLLVFDETILAEIFVPNSVICAKKCHKVFTKTIEQYLMFLKIKGTDKPAPLILAEAVGFEPTRRANALRDFERLPLWLRSSLSVPFFTRFCPKTGQNEPNPRKIDRKRIEKYGYRYNVSPSIRSYSFSAVS